MMNRPDTYGTTNTIATGLAAVGAINWGLKGLFRFNLVRALFGWSPFLTRAIYTIVGFAGGWLAYRVIDAMQRTPSMTGASGPTMRM